MAKQAFKWSRVSDEVIGEVIIPLGDVDVENQFDIVKARQGVNPKSAQRFRRKLSLPTTPAPGRGASPWASQTGSAKSDELAETRYSSFEECCEANPGVDLADLRDNIEGGYTHEGWVYRISDGGKVYRIEPDREGKNQTRNDEGGLGSLEVHITFGE